MELLGDAPAWDVIPLVVIPDTESRSLRDCVAVGQGDKVHVDILVRNALRYADHAIM